MNRIEKAFHLIELYCEIELRDIDADPQIMKVFPESYREKEILAILPNFAFPHKKMIEKSKSPTSYSFVLTSTTSSWQFGFCRKEINTSRAIIVLSFWPWHDIFLKLLNILADCRKRFSDREFNNYLTNVYRTKVPDEMSLINLSYGSGNLMQEFVFTRPSSRSLPSIPENHNLNLFYNYIEPKTMIEIFAALLAERRIIFLSTNLDKLSSCLQASCSLLFPMVWQHIYIPVLPMKLKDYLSAPMPYCIGVADAVFKTVRPDEIGDVVIVNCDDNCLQTPFNDTAHLPSDMVSYLKKQLTNPSADLRGNRIPKIFLSSLVPVIGGYRDAIKYTGSRLKFDNDTFIYSQSPQNKAFVQKIVELQIFQQFIEERIKLIENSAEVSDEFELEVELHAERMGKKINQYKEFIKNVRSRANPAVKNAVKSVKSKAKELKLKMNSSAQKSEKLDYSISRNQKPITMEPFPTFQQFYPSASNNLIASPSTSSSSSSDMNILQELEASGVFQSNGETSSANETQDECNLIDLSSDSTSTLDKFDPLMNGTRTSVVVPVARDPWGSSELLRNVIDELNKTSVGTNVVASKTSDWMKFD